MDVKYPLFDIFWDESDIKRVTNVIKRGTYWTTGPEIKEFERKLEEYFNIKYFVTFNSGTSALHSVLLAHGITTGEVIVPSMSFISTANCVILAGAKPIFADIEENTMGLDIEDIKEKICEKTRAIIAVNYGGRICRDIELLREIADDQNLILIEDNAESFGAKINDKFGGTIGHSGMLSFCQNKVLTTGEGGAICTTDEEVYKKLLLIRSHGRVEQVGKNYFSNIHEMDYVEIGYNFRMSSICAALGISQLEKIERIIELRRKVGKYYDEKFRNVSGVQIIPELRNCRNVYQLYSIILQNSEKRSELQDFLLKNGIITKVYFYPIHLKKYYRNKFGYHEGMIPKTEKFSKKLLSVPFSLNFTNQDQDYIINKIKGFLI